MKLLILCIFAVISASAKDWWENGNFYQIYPRSFMDSNGDGIGDLNGVAQRLQYLKGIGITAAWLSPIFESPMADFGYDISNYYQIHHEYGTMTDFENLLKKAKEIGVKIILDFVPNHTSDEHEWFQKSIAKDPVYSDFYVWEDPIYNESGRFPPNNWLSAFRYSAWEWNEERKQYYLHQFAIKQPDLNYRNPEVVQEMKNVISFWLKKGVSGFRIDAVPFLFEKEGLPDEPVKTDGSCPDPDDYCHLKHIYTNDQPETYDMIYQWRELVDNFKNENGGDSGVLLTEAYTNLDNIIKFYGNGTHNGSHVPFNFDLMSNTSANSNAVKFAERIDAFLSRVPPHQYANWVLGNHDNKRLASRYGENRTDLFNMLLQTLPGIAITYNGEEIGMTDVYIPWNETVDPQACNTDPERFNAFSRDPARTPFQWDSTKNAGFSNADKTWLPVSPDYPNNNVEKQKKQVVSNLHIFKKLLMLRKEPSFQDGDYEQITVGQNILVYKRELENSDIYIIVLNFGKTNHALNLKALFPSIGDKVEVITTSVQSIYSDGDLVNSRSVMAYSEVGTVFVSV